MQDLFANTLDGRNASVTEDFRASGRPARGLADVVAEAAGAGAWSEPVGARG